jgi:hypothetical protein
LAVTKGFGLGRLRRGCSSVNWFDEGVSLEDLADYDTRRFTKSLRKTPLSSSRRLNLYPNQGLKAAGAMLVRNRSVPELHPEYEEPVIANNRKVDHIHKHFEAMLRIADLAPNFRKYN